MLEIKYFSDLFQFPVFFDNYFVTLQKLLRKFNIKLFKIPTIINIKLKKNVHRIQHIKSKLKYTEK